MIQKGSRIIVALVLLTIAVAGVRIVKDGLHIEFDPFALIPTLPRLAQENSLRFLVEGPNSPAAARVLHESLADAVEWREFSIEELRHLCDVIAPYRAAITQPASDKLFACAPPPSCVREHLLGQMSAQAFSGDLFKCDPILLFPAAMEKLGESSMPENVIIGALRQGRTAKQIDDAVTQLRIKYPETTIVWSGFPRFAASSQARFNGEFAFISVLSLAGILLIVRLSIGTFLPLGVAILSSLAGCVVGGALCIAVEGKVHGITLSLGGGLLGACVDYSVLWLTRRYWHSDESTAKVWNNVSPVLRIGMLTSVIALVPFAFSASVLLLEFFLFCTGALAGSYAMLCVLPVPAPRDVSQQPFMVAARCCAWIARQLRTWRVVSVIIVVIVVGLRLVKANDDIRLLQPPDATLIRDELRISRGVVPSAHIVVKAPTDAETVSTFIDMIESINREKAGGHTTRLVVPIHFPTIAKQTETILAYQEYVEEHAAILSSTFEDLGIELDPAQFTKPNLKPLDLDFFRALIPEIVTANGEMILPVANPDPALVLPHYARLIDYRQTISDLFGSYRITSVYCLLLGYALVAATLVGYYKSWRAVGYMLPCVLAAVVTLAILGIAGIPLNFFTTIILALVMGLSIDYGVFFARAEKLEEVSLSIFASSATIVISFIPLLASDTPILQSVGLTMSIGVFLATLFAPMIWKPMPKS